MIWKEMLTGFLDCLSVYSIPTTVVIAVFILIDWILK